MAVTEYDAMDRIAAFLGLISLLFCSVSCESSPCRTLYGGRVECPYLPAPPGHTPTCAGPGLTYCERVEHYPHELVWRLVSLWNYDHKTLIRDESSLEFSAAPGAPQAWGHYRPHAGYHRYRQTPAPVQYDNRQHAYTNDDAYRSTNSFRNNSYGSAALNDGEGYHYPAPNQRNFRQRTWADGYSKRSRRQTRAGGETLCAAESRYITPQAAQTANTGDWKYVVNLPDSGNSPQTYTQLVRAETCAARNQQCSSLCSLPIGYTSRCEQRFVQKRLVALDSGGQRLYTDTFWFPSCCICTIDNR